MALTIEIEEFIENLFEREVVKKKKKNKTNSN